MYPRTRPQTLKSVLPYFHIAMEWVSILTSVVSSTGVTLAGAYWLSKAIISHRLSKDLEKHKNALDKELLDAKARLDEELTIKKAELDAQLVITKAGLDEHASVARANIEADLKREVEDYLGDRAAERQYRLEAKKRLYTAVGLLRFQLITASIDFANRVGGIGQGEQLYALSLDGYFGRSTTFRLLRVIAIADLIERQIAHADFSVEPSTVDLLRFKHAAFRAMSSSAVSLDHPANNWNDQTEHVYYDMLAMIASAIVLQDGAQQRVMRFSEFTELVETELGLSSIYPIPQLMEGFTPETKPILWLRFVALAELCNAFAARDRMQVGLAPEPYDGAALLLACKDEYVSCNHERYKDMLRTLTTPFATSVTAG
ncbi:MAG: hypothetical protein QOF63_1538 [Thermoanaerobaculia bacterium]|nr:hypothetical protein [Thermoanaerobaculia bacterium]